jgi:glycosyltransferase involved in cell wall biosynthesis
MSRPLILSYYFPPIGGAGAQRPAKFVRYLDALGYDPVVVTGPGQTIGRWTPRDETLTRDVPAHVEVRRTADEPRPTGGWRSRAERWLWLESMWPRWWIEQSVACGLGTEGVDVIYAVMSPYASADAAYQLSRMLGKPWIADLGDPWALDEMMIYPTAIHRRVELTKMRRLLGTAAAIVTTTSEAGRVIRRQFPELVDRTMVSIPCGFDSRDFEGAPPGRDDGLFRIVHTGYLHTDLGWQQRQVALGRRLLGGGVRGADMLTRSHVYLLLAIERLVARDPSLRSTIEVHLAGVLSSRDRQIAEQSDVVRMLGYLPHQETVELMRSADLLFLPMQRLSAGIRSSTVPGKTYEYLAAQRPILAAVPEGDARDILLQAGTAHVCDPDDVEAMATIVEDRLAGRLTLPRPDPNFLRRFEYRHLAEHVAELIDHVARGHQQRRGPLAADSASAAISASAVSLARFRKQHRNGKPSGRRILFLAYYFPPIGGAGAQRSLKLVRYLPGCGYSLSVLTGPGSSSGRWSPLDESMVTELPADTEGHRLPGREPDASGRWRSRMERWLSFESAWSRWWVEGAVKLGLEIGGEVDVIYASMSPYNSAEAAVILSKRLGVPWIAGLRDPWALDEMMIYPSALHRGRELAKMRRLLRTAAALEATTPEAARRIREEFPEWAAKPVVSIPNGFDIGDFAGPAPARNDAAFRIVHAGYLHTDLGLQQRRFTLARRLLGGGVKGADILTRSHVYLLLAIERLVARDPSLRSTIEVHLAGVLSSSDREAADQSDVVRMLGYLPHRETVELMRSADLLFLPMQRLPPGVRSTIVPGKTYEYLASQRPILAAVPEGDARDILLQVGTAHVCDPDDVEGMSAAIETELARWRSGTPAPSIRADSFERFERSNLAAELAAVVDVVLAEQPAAAKQLAVKTAP